jgi:hypothetical protein
VPDVLAMLGGEKEDAHEAISVVVRHNSDFANENHPSNPLNMSSNSCSSSAAVVRWKRGRSAPKREYRSADRSVRKIKGDILQYDRERLIPTSTSANDFEVLAKRRRVEPASF